MIIYFLTAGPGALECTSRTLSADEQRRRRPFPSKCLHIISSKKLLFTITRLSLSTLLIGLPHRTFFLSVRPICLDLLSAY